MDKKPLYKLFHCMYKALMQLRSFGLSFFCDEILFCNQYVPYCTTKYVFKLGKNNFESVGRQVF